MHSPAAAGELGRRLPGGDSGEPVAAGQPDDQGGVDVVDRSLEPEHDAVALRRLRARQVTPVGRREDQLHAVLRLLAQHQLVLDELLEGGADEQPLLLIDPRTRSDAGTAKSTSMTLLSRMLPSPSGSSLAAFTIALA